MTSRLGREQPVIFWAVLMTLCSAFLSAAEHPAYHVMPPNLQQFFRGSSSVSLSCVDDGQTADGWTVKRTRGNLTEDCGAAASEFSRINSSFCALGLSTGGSFLCVNSSGEQSDEVSISVSEGGVILEIPALPVMTGSDVTLYCTPKEGERRKSYFIRDNVPLGSGPEGKWILSKVQRSDEGLYSCSTDIHPPSPQSRLRVRDLSPADPPPTTTSPLLLTTFPPSSSSPHSSSFLPLYLLVLPVVLVLVLVGGVVLLKKLRVTKTSPAPEEVTYADINIRQKKKRRENHSLDPDTVYSAVRTHTAGPSEVTYGQVQIRSQRPAGRNTEYPADPDVVYSSVRAGK
ncbi:unnamed protein product [Oreochromis niloticus]|nr:unnamed protein product [Mustela putorius furo]